MILAHALEQLFPDADFLNDIILRDDGNGAFIAEWNLPDPIPTPAELETAWQMWLSKEPEREAYRQAEQGEKVDLSALLPQIAGELTWITTAIADIDTGLAQVDAATLAQLRVIVKGVMQNQRRILLEQRTELKAWRYVIRRLTS